MANEERGSSQVPLVITIVLLLAAGGWGYAQHSELVSKDAALKGLREAARAPGSASTPDDGTIKELLAKAHKGPPAVIRLGEVLEVTGAPDDASSDPQPDPAKLKALQETLLRALDSGEFTVDFAVDRYQAAPNDPVLKVTKTESGYKVSYGGTAELRGANPTMANVMDTVLVPAFRRMVADIKRYRDAYAAAKVAKETADKEYATVLAGKDKQISDLRQEMSSRENDLTRQISDLRRSVQDLEARVASTEQEKNTAVASLTKERDDARRAADQKSSEVQVLKERKRAVETDTSPDGAVTAVADGQRSVIINVGKSKNLIAGTNFEVYGSGKGGVAIHKGWVKVTTVGDFTSQCAVIDLADAYQPIVAGDAIRSLTYDPDEQIHFAMVGRFTKMGRSDAAARLRHLGSAVDDKVSISTHYLVVGAPEDETQPIEETEAYKTAKMYGVTIISERDLNRFTMY